MAKGDVMWRENLTWLINARLMQLPYLLEPQGAWSSFQQLLCVFAQFCQHLAWSGTIVIHMNSSFMYGVGGTFKINLKKLNSPFKYNPKISYYYHTARHSTEELTFTHPGHKLGGKCWFHFLHKDTLTCWLEEPVIESPSGEEDTGQTAGYYGQCHPLHTIICNQRRLFSERLLLPKCRTNKLKHSVVHRPACSTTAHLEGGGHRVQTTEGKEWYHLLWNNTCAHRPRHCSFVCSNLTDSALI